MNKEEYLKERKIIKRKKQIGVFAFFEEINVNELLSSIEKIKGDITYNSELNDGNKLKWSYDDFDDEITLYLSWKDYETEEEVERRLFEKEYFKKRAVDSMKELIAVNKEEAIEFIKELEKK